VITDANGEYSFSDLTPGTYHIRELVIGPWTRTSPASGVHDVTLDFKQTVNNLNFGNYEDIIIRRIKWDDLNGDGVHDVGEPGLPNWRIFLDEDLDGTYQVGEPVQFTGLNDEYEFTGLAPGIHTVAEEAQANWEQTFPTVGDASRHQFVVQSGDVIEDADFGNFQFAIISGQKVEYLTALPLAGWTIYLDLDRSGTFDAGEPFDVTDGVGHFYITGVVPGDYLLAEVPQIGWLQQFPGIDTNTGLPGHSVTVQSGDTPFHSFVNGETGRIEGIKWLDEDGDGVKDAVEPGLANWVMYLDTNGDGVFNEPDPLDPLAHSDPFVTTRFDDPDTPPDETGLYEFSDSLPDNYTVSEVIPSGWLQTSPGIPAMPVSYGANVLGGDVFLGRDFGNVQGASIHGTKWEDVDGDGVRDISNADPNSITGDLGLNGWRIELYDDQGNFIDFSITMDMDVDGSGTDGLDSDLDWDIMTDDVGMDGIPNTMDRGEGNHNPDPGEPHVDEQDGPINLDTERGLYWFTDLLPGTYIVCEVIPGGWAQTLPGPTQNLEYTATVEGGQVLTDIDFSNVQGAELHGTKFTDLDGDGELGADEPRLAGWTIFLDLDFDNELDADEPSQVTNANGKYWFMDLPPDTYAIVEDLDPMWQQTFPGDINFLRIWSVPKVVMSLQGWFFPTSRAPRFMGPSGTTWMAMGDAFPRSQYCQDGRFIWTST
jgi:hypothetical protein